MPDAPRIGVLLAAGRARRMGGVKQLLPWPAPDGDKPLVAAAYDAIRPICDEMLVVLGHEATMVAAALGERPFRWVSGDPDKPMFESIRAGIRAALAINDRATIVLQPGDHPGVKQGTLNAVLDTSLDRPNVTIIPEFDGRGGHPVLIPYNIAALLIDADCPHGLGQFWASQPELRLRIPVNDPSIVIDVDTRADMPS